ncbi:hypothetical protein FTO68_00485 [Methanocalculus taiwanensis]|uniref:Uncharacterized protein n=1 Tax=Methanocalculus taiwanensis TaxID=106207 RepID=A0ABD4THQ2_9EURY|nr:hypothetical protein [Methanocalculus taiwanensis]MCQ1537473.1 hypothetical protein [Methanocalculus taiwanensis]
MEKNKSPKTWIIVREGAILKNNSIDGMAFAKIITDLQRAIDTIGTSKYGKDYKKEDFRLFFKEIQKGSVIIPMYPMAYTTSLNRDNLFTDITGTMERLITTLNIKPDLFKEQFESEIISPGARIDLLKSFTSLSSLNSQIEIKTSYARPESGCFIPKHLTSYLNDLMIDYGGNGEVSVSGVIVRINGDREYYFTIEAKNGHKINCYFNPSEDETVKSLYKKWVHLAGEMTRTQKHAKIHSISELSEIKTETLLNAGNYVFRKPLTFDIHYDNEEKLWCIEQESLSLHAYGVNYNKALESLIDEIEGHIISFIHYPDERHTPESVELKKRLSEYIDFQAAEKIVQEKYGEV